MSQSGAVRMNVIAAACSNMGIGKDNALPWRLPNEFKFFVSKTAETTDINKKNVVIMGRRNWESIPSNFRPLKNRINIILSRTLKNKPEGCDYLCNSLDDALSTVQSAELRDIVETVWNIGGSEVYKIGMEHPTCHRIYLTRINADFECDTFFPTIPEDSFQIVDADDVPSGIQEEKGISYKFEVYERIPVANAS